MYCIETTGLTHRFSESETVLHDIHLQVPGGSIYGFLGPNGAGKTTTIRLLLGLLKKQTGSIHFFGQPFDRHRTEILQQTGSLIESPSLYGHLTAYENLAVLQKVYRCDKKRITEALEIVGLSHTGKKKAGRFSLGMKQRLSIAMAIMHRPRLLILDEPTNGLDPNGMIEIRELLKRLNAEEKTTILISSHLLAEIEKLVTHLGIISKGKIMFQGTLEQLHQAQTGTASIAFETAMPEQALDIARGSGFDAQYINGRLIIPHTEKTGIAALNARLVQNNVDVYQITTLKNDLESIFIDLTKN